VHPSPPPLLTREPGPWSINAEETAARRRAIVALNAVSGLAQLAHFGMLYPLLPLWLSTHGVAARHAGLVASCLWVGLLAGNLFAPQCLHRLGHRQASGLACAGTLLMGLGAWWLRPEWLIAWVLASALLGVCAGLRWVAVESWLYSISPTGSSGRAVGLHETVIYLGQGVGPALIAWVGVGSGHGFPLGAAFGLLAAVPLLAVRSSQLPTRLQPPMPVGQLLARLLRALPHWRARSAAHFGARLGLVGGLVDGLLLGMLAVYLVQRGASADRAALLMTAFGVGAGLAQWPLGWWSDRHNVRSATRRVAVLGAAGALLLLAGAPLWQWPAAVLTGAVAGGGLTVATIAAVEHASAAQADLRVAMTEVSVTFTVGSLIGPFLAGMLMDSLGPAAFVAAVLLSCLGLWLMAAEPAHPVGSEAAGATAP
jgi:MFS family permease